MARHEADREDLFAELVTAEARWELRIAGWDQPVVTGVRPRGIWSVYFSPDRCYHFDAQGGLRRAYIDGVLYRSEGTTLTRLVRERSDSETTLLSRSLTDADLAELLAEMRGWIQRFRNALNSDGFQVLRSEPAKVRIAILVDCCDLVLKGESPLSSGLVDRGA